MKNLQESCKKIVLSTFGVMFLFSSAIILTFVFLFFLPTHDALVEEHEAILQSIVPFVNKDLGFLTNDEESHMRDVARLGWLCILAAVVAGIICFRYGFSKAIRTSGFLLITTFLMSVLFFRQFWDFFHKIFFPQGNWQFPQDSMLITLYPQEYFFGATLVFLGMYCFVLIVAYKFEVLREEVVKTRQKLI